MSNPPPPNSRRERRQTEQKTYTKKATQKQHLRQPPKQTHQREIKRPLRKPTKRKGYKNQPAKSGRRRTGFRPLSSRALATPRKDQGQRTAVGADRKLDATEKGDAEQNKQNNAYKEYSDN